MSLLLRLLFSFFHTHKHWHLGLKVLSQLHEAIFDKQANLWFQTTEEIDVTCSLSTYAKICNYRKMLHR